MAVRPQKSTDRLCPIGGWRYAPPPRSPWLLGLSPAVKLFDSVPLRSLPPNAITASAMACGLVSIYQSLSEHDFPLAAWLVLWSVLLDKLDGSVARALKSSSEFGVQFDSFADCTAFGAAPAALLFAAAPVLAPTVWGPAATVGGSPAVVPLAAICLIYPVFTAVRLAKFNVTTAAIGPYLFLGLPSTLSGGLLCSAFLAVFELQLETTQPWLFAAMPLLMLLNAALMVSNLPLPKFKVSAHLPVKLFQFAAAIAVYVLVPLRTGFVAVLALLVGYLLVGFAWLGPRLLAESRAQSGDLAQNPKAV